MLEGIPLRGIPKQRQGFYAAQTEKRNEYESKGMEIVQNGMISGIASAISNQSLARRLPV